MPVRKGSKLKPKGFDSDGFLVCERELDDGAVVHTKVAPGGTKLPEDCEDRQTVVVKVQDDSSLKVVEVLGHDGPARASNEAYREGWDLVFKKTLN